MNIFERFVVIIIYINDRKESIHASPVIDSLYR